MDGSKNNARLTRWRSSIVIALGAMALGLGLGAAPALAGDIVLSLSAPRGSVAVGSSVELGLRNKSGGPKDVYPVDCEVVAPGGKKFRAKAELKGAEWTYLIYPRDFAGATQPAAGKYKVKWSVAKRGSTTDSFDVK